MPFIRMDPETWDEYMGAFDPKELEELGASRPSGNFDYQAISERFSPEELGPVAREMLEVLTAAGVTSFRARYDGGFDEGFIYPATFLVGTEEHGVKDVLQRLASPDLTVRLREAAIRENTIELYPDTPPTEPPPSEFGAEDQWEVYAHATSFEAAEMALYDLGGALAVKVAGYGFGTGEYQLYGAFTANFRTGELIDDPKAVKPAKME
jgi:hypothetical protein